MATGIIELVGELLDPEYDPDGVAAFAASADIGTGVLTPVGVLDPATVVAVRAGGPVDRDGPAQVVGRRAAATLPGRDRRPPRTAPAPATGEAGSKQWAREEVACALRWSFGTTATRLGNATELVRRLPDTLDALETGTISPGHVRVLVDAVAHLSDEIASAVQARVLPRAGSQTVAEFRRCVQTGRALAGCCRAGTTPPGRGG